MILEKEYREKLALLDKILNVVDEGMVEELFEKENIVSKLKGVSVQKNVMQHIVDLIEHDQSTISRLEGELSNLRHDLQSVIHILNQVLSVAPMTNGHLSALKSKYNIYY